MPLRDLTEDTQWYKEKYLDYREFAERVAKILTEILNIEKVNYAFIHFRAKALDSYQAKLREVDYSGKEMRDLAGVRIVGYVRSDVEKIIRVIKQNLAVDESKDKSMELGNNKIGYRSIHIICTLPKQRTVLPEYRKFENMLVEIQVRTILEHTWAEIEHDRNYKYKGLPEDIKRDFYLIAASLEIADKQVDQITHRIEEYESKIKKKEEQGRLVDVPIDAMSLKRYLSDRFSKKLGLDATYGQNGDGSMEVRELLAMGVTNLAQLEEIIPANLAEIEKMYTQMYMQFDPVPNLTGIVFSILILTYGDKYYGVSKDTRDISEDRFEEFKAQYGKVVDIVSKSET